MSDRQRNGSAFPRPHVIWMQKIGDIEAFGYRRADIWFHEAPGMHEGREVRWGTDKHAGPAVRTVTICRPSKTARSAGTIAIRTKRPEACVVLHTGFRYDALHGSYQSFLPVQR